MLLEINLLPKKEQRTKGFILTLSGLIAALILISGYYLWQISSTKSDIDATGSQVTEIQKIAEKESANINTTPEPTQSVSLLINAVEWANHYPIQTVPIMQHLTSLLPERGFIKSFEYTEEGSVILTVQFDSSRESAYFLNNLNDSKWIEDSTLNALTTSEQTETDSSNQTQTTENTYLPRYIGQYEIKFNIETIKKELNKDISSEEGANNS
jgi:Tfp pilus assembly protein PilN